MKLSEVQPNRFEAYKNFLNKLNGSEQAKVNLASGKLLLSDYQGQIWVLPDSENAEAMVKMTPSDPGNSAWEQLSVP